jgi:hypothetical protein
VAVVGERLAAGKNMNTHQVTLNGQVVAVGRDHFTLLTMVRSFEHHDRELNRISTHELAIEGIDAYGPVTQFVPPLSLKKGDVIQIVIGEIPEAQA